MRIEEFDRMPDDEARRALHGVCAAPRWAEKVAAGRPYGSAGALQDAAGAALDVDDLDAAMAGHPRIGDRSATGRSGAEQAGVAGSDAGTLAALEAGNADYERRFGHVYLVCAAGRGAEDLLVTLHERLHNDPATERVVALAELAAINRLRLAGMVEEDR
ncbi:2-oxo-4-hydroxy-4-carboxy-5-ureidoimidazoline decarboxylase [Pseudonocardia sp. KRD291]|uniref:2-oxo-4-hydroxy-4-carboxy-5-ureidoimidazoline decarboxylase n=1 Tax=Pseudonocardia sp. KRD291 TaxID=2792007 RepID=UPI001C49FC42|nr:2-oxo-4-hydroxy-4-carboxy-5-ureidoimidazoline decarboxylase [Pseudonocardia sp. KRD291]MBW0102857.1 2-oxo-4-hydroxy-4-carboxy-5-ureidoimidazoline decarboxylase [Pseudonocardia sp. KRD291]